MSSPHMNAWLAAALSLVVSVSVWEAEMSADMGRPPAVEPTAPPTEDDDGAAAQPTPTPPPVALDPEEAEPCPPARRPRPRLVRRDFSWRWCSPP